ncbi:MAG: type II toxin-antitoxin system Phd/YefM family antitoxin [Acidobacteriota bacterium]
MNISTKEAREQLSDLISRAAFAKERIILTRHGKAVAAVVPIEDYDLLEQIEDRIDLEEARAVLAETKKKGTIPWEKLKAELDL